MALDKNLQNPLYRQLMEQIKNSINIGEYKSGDKIPTETELEQMYKVSRITVRRTIEELCNMGYLVKIQGKGTFVAAPRIYRKVEQKSNMSFTEACKASGRFPTSHVIDCRLTNPDVRQNEFFHLPPNEMIYHVQRILSADELPIIYEHLFLPYKRFPSFQVEKLENASFYQILKEEYHIQELIKNRSTIDLEIASQKSAEQLQIMANEPVMELCNYVSEENGEPIYMTREIIVGSRYRLSF